MNTDAWVPNFSFAQGNLAGFQSVFARQAESYLKASSQVLDNLEGYSQLWLRYRREHIENSLRAVHDVIGSQDIGQTMAIYNDWLSTSIKKLSEEASAIPEQIRQFSESAQHFGEESVQAVQDNLQEIENQVRAQRDREQQSHDYRVAPGQEKQQGQEYRVAPGQEKQQGQEHRVA